jgi:hypothetical protein
MHNLVIADETEFLARITRHMVKYLELRAESRSYCEWSSGKRVYLHYKPRHCSVVKQDEEESFHIYVRTSKRRPTINVADGISPNPSWWNMEDISGG